jgi:hypothetical protein
MRKRTVRPGLEALEGRWCPSLTAQIHHGDLVISGTPTGTNATGGLLIQGTAAHTNNFTVKDGSMVLGTFHVTGDVVLNLTNHQTEGINVDLNSNSIPDDLLINLGAGNSSGGATTGKIGGDLAVRGGSGSETFIPGFQNNFTDAPAAFGLRVGGDLTFDAKVGGATSSSFDVMDTGAEAPAPPTVVVGGDVETTAVDVVGLGPTTTVGESVFIAAVGERPLFVEDFATVHGSVTVTGSRLRAPNPVLGASQMGDFIEVGGSPTGTAVVGGSLRLSSGAGDAFFLIDPGTQVHGRATIRAGSGSDTVSAAGTFHRSLSIRLGNGNDSVSLAAGASVQEDVSIRLGNGNDSVTVDGKVGDDLRFDLGNGNNVVTVGPAPGDRLLWESGNGNDSVTLGDSHTAPGSAWNVHMEFGKGHDTLTLSSAAPGAQFISGFVDLGGPPGGNVFNKGANWVIVQPFKLRNV